ncbi:hypothetical protein QN277_024562 [Acacia crassicarpa]|uniref:SKP1-like protein n=1 Tax=Acacia crassicarpa TaxID=499986 RepID=A0AAE1K7U0_9FABA|nr:hypothetical protein QN277_024562 [Acacia crassicarpa]
MSSSVEAITLVCSDGGEFKITVRAAKLSSLLNRLLAEDVCVSDDRKIEITGGVDSKTLVKVIEYCEKHAPTADSGASDSDAEELKKWDIEFMKMDVEDILFHIVMAANYLNIKGLSDLACQTVADLMKGMTVSQMRKIFHIENDFSSEEQEELRRQHPECFFD